MFCNTSIDWQAAAAWAQFGAAILAVIAAYMIGRAQMAAQQDVAAKGRQQFAKLVLGICQQAQSDIVHAVELLSDDHMEWFMSGEGYVPNMVPTIQAIRGLDLNRMPSADVALAVNELRRLCGWAKVYQGHAEHDWKTHSMISPDLENDLREWREKANAALEEVRSGLANDLG